MSGLELENTKITVNFKMRIEPLAYSYIDGDVQRVTSNLATNTYLDMSIKSLHIE
jgi:hypothetical protein